MATIVTTRYNNYTWNETYNYRKKRKLSCIYGPPCKLSPSIDLDSPVFVVEMNNEMNEVIGIGLIKNKLETNRVYKIYDDNNYNRYIYIGEYHISRETIERHNKELLSILDTILFKGYTHSKRGAGLTKIPEKVLSLDVCKNVNIKKEIKTIFKNHFTPLKI